METYDETRIYTIGYPKISTGMRQWLDTYLW